MGIPSFPHFHSPSSSPPLESRKKLFKIMPESQHAQRILFTLLLNSWRCSLLNYGQISLSLFTVQEHCSNIYKYIGSLKYLCTWFGKTSSRVSFEIAFRVKMLWGCILTLVVLFLIFIHTKVRTYWWQISLGFCTSAKMFPLSSTALSESL